MTMKANRLRLCFALAGLLLPSPRSVSAAGPEKDWLVPGGQSLSQGDRDSLVWVRLGRVESLAFSHDGQTLASGSEDGTLCIWTLSTGRPRHCGWQGQHGRITRVVFSAQDDLLAAGRSDGSVDVLRPNGQPAEAACVHGPLPEQPKLGRAIADLVFTGRNGELTSTGTRSHSLRRCAPLASPAQARAASGQTPRSAEKLPAVSGLPATRWDLAAFDARGQTLALVTSGSVSLWDVGSGTLRWQTRDVDSLPVSLALSDDGQRLAVGTQSGQVVLWQGAGHAKTPLRRQGQAAHGAAVRSVQFGRDGTWLLSGSNDNVVALWNVPEARLVQSHTLERPGWNALALRDDGMQWAVAMTDGQIEIRSRDSDQPLRTLRGNAPATRALAWGDEGRVLAVASEDRHVRIWRRTRDSATPTAAQDDGEAPSGRWELACDTGPLGGLHAIAFQPGPAQRLAIALDAPQIQLFDGAQCQRATLLPQGTDWQGSLAFSPDGRFLASGTTRGIIHVWRLTSDGAEEKARMESHRDEVTALAYSPTATGILASGSFDKTVHLWDSLRGSDLHVFPEHSEGVRFVTFSPDGKLLAAGGGKDVVLWDVERRALADAAIPRLTHDQSVGGLAFSGDGSLLLTTASDGQIRVWDRYTQKSLSTFSALADRAAGSPSTARSPPVLAVVGSGTASAVSVGLPGRVAVWAVSRSVDPMGPPSVVSVQQALLFAAGEAWALWTPLHRLFRHDLGELLWQRSAGGTLSPLPPPRSDPKLDWTVTRVSNARSLWQIESLRIDVHNRSATDPAYWLRLEASPAPGRRALGATAQPSAIEPLVAPGEHAQLSLDLALLRGADRPLWPPRSLPICVSVRHAQHDEGPCEGPLSQTLTLSVGPWWWRHAAALLGLAGLFLAAVWLRQRRKFLQQPLFVAVDAGRDPLLALSFHQLVAAARPSVGHSLFLLRRAHQQALRTVMSSQAAIARTRHALGHAEHCVPAFLERLAGQRVDAHPAEADDPSRQPVDKRAAHTYTVTLPNLALHLPSHALLIVGAGSPQPAGRADDSDAPSVDDLLLHCDPRLVYKHTLVLVLDLAQRSQRAAFLEAGAALSAQYPGKLFVLLDEPALRRILLAEDAPTAQAALREQIVAQCNPVAIVSYHEGGAIPPEEEGLFFGRRHELERLLRGQGHNFLVVGPRQMGKSSLINALFRELQRREPGVRVVRYDPSNGSLAGIEAVDPVLCGDTPAQFYSSVMRRSTAHQVFLFDETDRFVAREADTQYGFCNVMRALSSQGRASFVLAGYQDLLEATQTGDHPLRNFGEVLRLEPLDPESAERMILGPLSAVGLRFQDPRGTVDWLRTQTACRPHLISKLCFKLVKLRPSRSTRTLGLAEVRNAVLSAEFLHGVFESWDSDAVQAIDRAAMRACLLLGSPRPQDLLQYLNQQGAHLDRAELDQSLGRLYAWHYALIVDGKGQLVCPVPLFQHYLSDPRPDPVSGQPYADAESRLADQLRKDIADANAAPDRAADIPS